MRSAFVFAISLMALAGAAFLFGPQYGLDPWAIWDLWSPRTFESEPAEPPTGTAAAASAAGEQGAAKKRLARSRAANDAQSPAERGPERLEPGSGRRLASKGAANRQDLQAARELVQVTVYYTQGCRYCTAARRFLTQKGIRFESHDIEADPSARSRQRALNPGGTVPTLDVDGEVLVGFNARHITSAIDRAARRRIER
jgi:glutaredoxin 3